MLLEIPKKNSSVPFSKKRLNFLTPTPPNPQFPLLIYLPGMDGSGLLLREQIPHLQTKFDLRCLSFPPEDRSDWEDLVKQTIELIKNELKKNYHRPIYLCGESFGGCLALQIALKDPSLIQRLIVINSASAFRHQPLIQWAVSFTQWIPNFFYNLSVFGLFNFLACVDRMSYPNQEALLKATQAVSQSTSAWRLNLVNNLKISEQELNRILIPTLIIASGADQLLPSITESDLLVKNIPQSYRIILPKSGHACLLETEVNLGKIIEQWENLGNFPS